MKKTIFILLATLLAISSGCKKDKEAEKDVAIAKKYAKYKKAIYEDKEMKKWVATLEKAEDVSLLEEEEYKNSKGQTDKISKIKLADDKIGYVESRHLADRPIVFTKETKAFVRPTSGSRIFATIPKGELGFIIEEKGLWVQVYVGEVDGKNITKQWVEDGYTADENTVLEAKEYARTLAGLKEDDPEKISEAEENLEKLSSSSSVIGELAKEKLKKLENNSQMNTEEPVIEEVEEIDVP